MLNTQSRFVLCGVMVMSVCGVASGAIVITSISTAVFGNATGAQPGSYYQEYDWPNWEITRSVVWPEAEAHSYLKTEADPSIPLPTMPGSYAFLKGFGSASARGDAEAYASLGVQFECAEAWDVRLVTTGLGTIMLHGPSGLITWVKGDQSFVATLGPGAYRVSASVSAINDGGSVFFVVPGPGAAALPGAAVLMLTARRKRGRG